MKCTLVKLLKVCPRRCIKPESSYYITQENCLHCGNCFEHCPVKAIRQL
ncbi:MAG: 4Fe-4S binding protein [Lachnoclostridium edouardi]|nr:4Fe-4S binding protein [Lachnoclostridium edouardi]MDO4278016.1 4Fe-4S binding protein [Lachnoclostridium edouardi]